MMAMLLKSYVFVIVFCQGYANKLDERMRRNRSGLVEMQSSNRENPPETECLSGWLPFGNKCFAAFGTASEGKLSWADAAARCRTFGGHLASIHSQKEQEFIENNFLKIKKTTLWIGLHNNHPYKYEWDDQSPVNYFNWSPREPNAPEIKLCGEIWYKTEGNWNDHDCSVRNIYLCQTKQAEHSTMSPDIAICKGKNCALTKGDKISLRKSKNKSHSTTTIAVIACSVSLVIILIGVVTYRTHPWRYLFSHMKSRKSFQSDEEPSNKYGTMELDEEETKDF